MTINGHVIMWPHTQKDSKMYKVRGGISTGNNLSHEFPVLSDAMDFADKLWESGFYQAEVLDGRELVYYVVDHAPRTHEERTRRQAAAQLFIKLWHAKLEQDEAYATYAQNISTTRDLDAIFSSCPGYLRRAHEGHEVY